MARYYNIISADGHVETPPESWVKYVPEKYKSRAPRLIDLEDGGQAWVVENKPVLQNGLNITGNRTLPPGKDISGVRFASESYWNKDGTAAPGSGNGIQRLQEQDQDGIDAEVLYPPVFATTFIEGIQDKKAYLAMVQAYNTFLAETYCAVAPDRLIGNAVVPVTGVEDAIAELKRCKELGIISVSPHMFPNGSGKPAPEDDPYWETALNIDMKVSPHLTIGDREPGPPGSATGPGAAAIRALGAGRGGGGPTHAVAQMIAYGVLDRFPDLRLYIAESNASWLPGAMWFMDDSYKTWRSGVGVTLKMMPSEYLKKHFMFSFIRDPMAMKMRNLLPTDNLMWGSDFPHSVGSFPNSQGWLKIIFEGVPEDIEKKILVENPCRFFGLDMTKAITETPTAAASETAWARSS